jgi:hypothetical protein
MIPNKARARALSGVSRSKKQKSMNLTGGTFAGFQTGLRCFLFSLSFILLLG